MWWPTATTKAEEDEQQGLELVLASRPPSSSSPPLTVVSVSASKVGTAVVAGDLSFGWARRFAGLFSSAGEEEEEEEEEQESRSGGSRPPSPMIPLDRLPAELLPPVLAPVLPASTASTPSPSSVLRWSVAARDCAVRYDPPPLASASSAASGAAWPASGPTAG